MAPWYRSAEARVPSAPDGQGRPGWEGEGTHGYTHSVTAVTRPLARLLSPRQYERSSAYNRQLLRHLGGVVLDVGCGAFHRKFPLPHGVRYYGLDISPRTTHVRGDGHRLPFADRSVDWVLLVAVLEHVEDPRRVLAETMRVLKPGGRVYVAVPFLQMEHAREDYWRWTGQGLPRLLCDAGLTILEGGANGGPFVAVDYLLWHTLRQAWARRQWDVLLPAALLKVLAQPLSRLDRAVGDPAFATSFHYLAGRTQGHDAGSTDLR